MAASVLWAVLAGLMYSVLLVGIEIKFSQYSPQTLQLCFYPIMLVIAVGWIMTRRGMGGVENVFPASALVLVGLLLGIVYYFADVALLKALTAGGSAVVVAIVLAMSPVFTATVRYLWIGGLPNKYHLAAFALALATVALAAKGEMVNMANAQR